MDVATFLFLFLEPEVTIFVREGGFWEDILIGSDSKPEEATTITITPALSSVLL